MSAVLSGTSDDAVLWRTVELLGGSRVIKGRPSSRSEIHASLVRGIPNAALAHLVDSLVLVSEDAVAGVVGVSTRTLRRSRDDPKRLMAPDLASRAWLLAETLAKAAEVLGGKDEAERWLSEEAMGLGGARPIDLLRTMQGAELVSEFLGRLDTGVYV